MNFYFVIAKHMKYNYFLGIRFWNGETENLLVSADQTGGLFTVPSAPSLSAMNNDKPLSRAYRASDWAVVDGGYVALILRICFGKSIRRISGLQILQKLIGVDYSHALPMKERVILWVVPNSREKDAICSYLLQGSFDLKRQHFYEAPFYKSESDFADLKLLDKAKEVSPDWIILCIGGGRQEKLGYFIKKRFDCFQRKPVVLCTGGAISFLTGTQANIPTWADRLYLGWLMRVFSDPRLFGARYLDAAWRFPKLLWTSRKCLFIENEPHA
ncbi:MAG: glycosyltransferase [Sphingobacteriales bacterium]|nr:MAG: glycosyltransferase [Sphingobacteriales bacterium]